MARPIDESDCLELVSIGTLYRGPWDKKYWSSSRGRDRYPYPVGYHVLRVHNGVTYKIEIQEGTQGPTFQVTSSDGHVGSGRTPDLACEDFQKKSSSHVKMWHAKRFSCKVDGVEFFGFKNALVQRLIRELMANVNASSDQSLPSTSFCDEPMAKDHDSPSPQGCQYPDLVKHSSKSKNARKRSRMPEFITSKTASVTATFQPYEASSAKLLFSGGQNESDEEKPVLTSVCTKEYGTGCDIGVSSACLEPCIEVPVSDDQPHCRSDNGCVHSDGKTCFTQQKQPFSFVPDHLASIRVNPELSGESTTFDRPESLGVQRSIPSVAAEAGTEESLIVNDSEGSVDSQIDKNSHLFVPDTLDTQQEYVISHDSRCIEVHRETKEDTAAENSLLSKVPVESASQGHLGTISDSFDSPEVDSVGEEVVKSMMSILLPKAPPLLTYRSRRKKKKLNAPTGVLSTPTSDEKMLSENFKLNEPEEEPKEDNSTRHSGMDASEIGVYAGPENTSESILFQSNAAHATEQFHDTAKVVEPNMGKIMPSLDLGEMQFSAHTNKDLAASHGHTCIGRQKDPSIPTTTHYTSASPFEGPLSLVQNEGGVLETDLVSVPLQESNVMEPEVSSVTTKFIPAGSVGTTQVPEKDHSSREIVNALIDSSIPRSATEARGINSHMPLSESKLCRNMGEESLLTTGLEDNLPGIQDGQRATIFSASDHEKVTPNLDGIEHKTMIHDKFEHPIKLIGCYSHPMRISSVTITRVINDIYLCVSCHLREENKRNLFLYKLPVNQPSLGSPSFVGHIVLTLPVLKDTHGKEISVERAGMQFTPDARALILLDSIEFPDCRKEEHPCSCSSCLPYRSEESGVKIVEVGLGHASLLVKLRTANPVHVLLVCESSHLVALDESGVLYVWVMNPTWSAPTEDYTISSYDHVASRVVDLKNVPQCASLVVGHNGCGDFSLWDIIKRTVVLRFSGPASSIFDFLPISLISWSTKDMFDCKHDESICKATVTEATRKGLLDCRNKIAVSSIEENVAIWVLVLTDSNFCVEPGFQSSRCQKSSICWKLGLLVKDRVVLGTTIPRSLVINVAAGHGIMGTKEGEVYIWELLGGTMVKIIDDFEGTIVSHIATDDFVVAIAGEDLKLRVYILC